MTPFRVKEMTVSTYLPDENGNLSLDEKNLAKVERLIHIDWSDNKYTSPSTGSRF
jgi:hypothetical protein